MFRRQFVAAVPAAFAGPALVGARACVTPADVQYVKTAREQLQTIDHQVGSDGLEPIARRYLAQADALLENARPDALGRELRSATGKLAASTGWFAVDRQQYPLAHAYFGQALFHARLAQDTQLEACVHWCMMSAALGVNQPGAALSHGEAALRLASEVSWERSLLESHMARAYAQRGDQRAAAEALAQAQSTWESATAEASPVAWAAFADEAEMLGAQGRCALELGQHHQAAALYERSVSLSGYFLRNRAVRGAELANARLGCGEVEGACEAATAVMSSNVASGDARRRLAVFARDLSRFDTDAARDFLARWSEPH